MEYAATEYAQTQGVDDMNCDMSTAQIAALTCQHLKELELRERNLKDLEDLQKVISFEEDDFLSTEEVLSRVLDFYERFVHFRNVF